MDKKNTIEGHAKLQGLTVSSFIAMCGLSPSTYSRRMNNPDSITLGEFRRMDEVAHFPDEVIVKLVRKV